MNKRVGIVVPTLGRRPEFLLQCLESIKGAGESYVTLVAPETFDIQVFFELGLVDQFVADQGAGLPVAINEGIERLPSNIEYVNWLGDDDLLATQSIDVAVKALDSDPGIVLVYGSCNYIDSNGKLVWVNKSGRWARPLLHFGPDLIPQPGALFRRSVFEDLGGLDQALEWAFDFDLFLNLKKIGKLHFLNKTLASFRWHPDSLSVGQRVKSVAEASKVRISHLPRHLRSISFLWEFPVRKATLIAGHRLSLKLEGLPK